MNEAVNKEHVRLWVQALRSPGLIQGHGALAKRKSEDEPWQQCCLDVACRVAMDNGVELEETVDQQTWGWSRGYVFNLKTPPEVEPWKEFTTMPNVVRTWYGFDYGNVSPMKYGAREDVSAIDLNDELRLSFAVIADIIEATFLADDK